jgi:hypothetical protein
VDRDEKLLSEVEDILRKTPKDDPKRKDWEQKLAVQKSRFEKAKQHMKNAADKL